MRKAATVITLSLGIPFATALAPPLLAQKAPATSPTVTPSSIKFDVVSVKPDKSTAGPPGSGMPMMIRDDGFYSINTDLLWDLYYVYELDRDESHFSGLPAWTKYERFDIIAKVAGPDVATWKKLKNNEQRRMVREVLEDKFKLQIHPEPREQSIYALVIAPGGPKMTQVDPPEKGDIYGPTGYAAVNLSGVDGIHITMKNFAQYLSHLNLGKVVQDQTGLTSTYSFKLKFTPEQKGSLGGDDVSAPPIDTSEPFIFKALQEQLGLQLKPAKGPVDVLIVDRVEHPPEN